MSWFSAEYHASLSLPVALPGGGGQRKEERDHIDKQWVTDGDKLDCQDNRRNWLFFLKINNDGYEEVEQC